MTADEIIQYAYNAGRHAEKLESFNRDAREVINEIAELELHKVEAQKDIRRDERHALRGLRRNIRPVVRPSS